jgi:NADH-quinone oxidoreductase subunit M
MQQVSGLARRMPVWGFFMVLFVMASVGLPGLNGFVSEFLCIIGAFSASADAMPYPGRLGPWYGVAAGAGLIIGAMYLLMITGKVVFGPLKEPPAEHDTLPADLSWREIGVLAPLAVLCVYLGFQPKPLTDAMAGSIDTLLAGYPAEVQQYRAQHETQPVEGMALVLPGEDHGDG